MRATLAQAKEWNQTEEKWIYCVDLLGISTEQLNSSRLVTDLEQQFEELLAVEELNKLIKRYPSYNLGYDEETETYSLGTAEDDEDWGLCFECEIEGASAQEIVKYIKEERGIK